jgi:Mrp family chromosome partitioning ATPase
MTILEALERAKRIRAEKTRDGVEVQSADTAPATRRKKLEVMPSAPAVALDFAQLSIDPAVCARNRVLVSGLSGHPQAHIVDAYRMVRTRLRRWMGAEQSPGLGVVSAGPDEGKSVTSINLALAFAREKKQNVFLLDLDLRNPSLCRYLGASPPAEIGSYLAGGTRAEDIFFTTGIDNLVLAGSLSSHDNSSELLGGDALAALFAYIRKTDPQALILVDLPPLLQSADALIVAPHLTAALLVVADGITRRDQLDRATELLAGMTVAGVVLNRSREGVEDYYG